MLVCNTEPPGPPVINMVMALNSFSASLSWTSPPYNCSLNYTLEVVHKENASVVFLSNSSINVTTLMVGQSYSFRVASVDAADRMSNWSQPVLLTMQGLLLFYNHNNFIKLFALLQLTCSTGTSGSYYSYNKSVITTELLHHC